MDRVIDGEPTLEDYKVGFSIIKDLRKIVMKPKISRQSVHKIINQFSFYNVEL
jgi:hypothetical protein